MRRERTRVNYVFLGIVEREGKILMQRRFEPENPAAHNTWEVPGGTLEYGETPEQTVEREVYEETGYRVKAVTMVPFYRVSYWVYPTFRQQTISLSFICSLVNDTRSQIPPDHHIAEIRWISLPEIEELPTLSGIKELLTAYRKLKV